MSFPAAVHEARHHTARGPSETWALSEALGRPGPVLERMRQEHGKALTAPMEANTGSGVGKQGANLASVMYFTSSGLLPQNGNPGKGEGAC